MAFFSSCLENDGQTLFSLLFLGFILILKKNHETLDSFSFLLVLVWHLKSDQENDHKILALKWKPSIHRSLSMNTWKWSLCIGILRLQTSILIYASYLYWLQCLYNKSRSFHVTSFKRFPSKPSQEGKQQNSWFKSTTFALHWYWV